MSRNLLRYIMLMLSLTLSNQFRSHLPLRLRNEENVDLPFIVSLIAKVERISSSVIRTCTGSLVSSQFVVTAAHCLIPSLKYVRCGNMSLSINETICKSHILKKIAHPGYTPGQSFSNNDIGLIKVKPLVMKHYGILISIDYKTLLGKAVRYAGYGGMIALRANDAKRIIKLQKEPLQLGEGVIYDTHNRDKIGGNPLLLVAPMCMKKGQKEPEQFIGDPGGPLFLGSKILGVTCCVSIKNKRYQPVLSGFTPVSPYLLWINSIIKNCESDIDID